MYTIRGAITIEKDCILAVQSAVTELLSTILQKNNLQMEEVMTILFSNTIDITSYYPAKAAREFGFVNATLFSMQEPNIQNALPKTIRALLFIEPNIINENFLKTTYMPEENSQVSIVNHAITNFMKNNDDANEYREEGQYANNMQYENEQAIDAKKNKFTLQNVAAYDKIEKNNKNEVVHVYLKGAKFLRSDLQKLIIAIDGPAGSGKSTLAKMLAEKTGLLHLDSGAIYRAVAYYCIEKHLEIENSIQIAENIEKMHLYVKHIDKIQHVFLEDNDITLNIRTQEISHAAAVIAKYAPVRNLVDAIQRDIAQNIACIVDGRDIGTYLFPNANYKFFLTATPEIRTKRRFLEMQKKENTITYEAVYKEIVARDLSDKTRAIAPLTIAEDAIVIDTSTMTLEQVLDKMIKILQES